MTALESSLARYRAVIASTLDCVVAVDEQDRLIEFNPAAERTFDYLAADVLGREVADLLVPPENRAFYRSLAQRIRDNPGSSLLDRRIETTAMRSDGSEFPVELTVARVEGAGGLGPSFYGIVRDIGERRRGRGAARLPGLPRRADRPAQPDPRRAGDRPGPGPRPARRRRGGADVRRPRRLQGGQRPPRPRRRRPAAGQRVGPPARRPARLATCWPARAATSSWCCSATSPTIPRAAAESVGGKLLNALLEPFVVAGTEVRTGASIGISLYPRRRRRHRGAAAPRRRRHVPRQGGRRRAPRLPPALRRRWPRAARA